ncbi:MAG: Smr/MutS family protein [Caldimicrobium sp.]|nr:Smr/MutS family protein [Caldimicrobium sp.]
MAKDFSLLEWENLISYLEPFLRVEPSKSTIKRWNPLISPSKSRELLEETKFLWELLERGLGIELPTLSSLKKIFENGDRRGLFLPSEITHIGTWILTAKGLDKTLKNSPFNSIVEISKSLEPLLKEISHVCDLQRGEIRDQASYNLYLIRQKIAQLKEEILNRLERIKDHYVSLGYLQDNLFLYKEGRYVLPVKLEYKNKVKGLLQGFSQSGSTAFIEPIGIINLRNDLEELYWEEQREISQLLKSITFMILAQRDTLLRLEYFMIRLDLALAKAKLGRLYRGVFPELIETGDLEIKQAIHPILFLKSLEQEGATLVFNNYHLKDCLVITGPNLGGKTVSLKTIGLILLMAYNGFLVPAREAKVPRFSEILVDMGDEQNLLAGDSSFSSHLKNLKRILEKSKSNSLVLLDEPGRGTDPAEGAALVFAIVDNLIKKGSKVVLTTHSYHLKTLLMRREEFALATMGFDPDSHHPTFQLIYGLLGGSYAFELAEKIGFDASLLSYAKSLLVDREYYHWQERYADELKKLKALRAEWEEKVKMVATRERELETFKRDLQRRFDEKVAKVFEDWQREFREFLQRLSSKKSKQRAHGEFQRFIKERESIFFEDKDTLYAGDRVWLTSLKREGKILKIKGNHAEVQIGSLKIEVPFYELKRMSSGPCLRDSKEFCLKEDKSPVNYRDRIILLGENIDTGLLLLERKLNECFLKGVKSLIIIHGHGSGKLRLAVREYLKDHPLIERFEVAPPYEGGNGATIAYICQKN